MLLGTDLDILILLIPGLVFSLCVHEFAHGYVAYRLGDNTAANAGRLTLNPLKHLDPTGSLMILFVGFGWAKPVPISPHLSGRELRAVAFAGPASNLILAFLGGLIIRYFNTEVSFINESIFQAIFLFLIININLAVFNMLPIAPLDGSQIFSSILPREIALKLQIYGPQVLLGLILFGVITGHSIIWKIMKPFITFFVYIFSGITI